MKEAAEKRGIKTSIITILPSDLSTKKVNSKLGDVIIWRRSKLDIKSERPSLEAALKDKIVVSDTVFRFPAVYYKYYQQQVIGQESTTSKWSIPTFRFNTKKSFNKAIEDGLLTLPIIAKPNAGSRGEGIELLKEAVDINTVKHLKNYVFQSFIPNNGDWRIIIIGGSPIGILSRHGQEGQFINNISQGAYGSIELDTETLATLRKISTKVASLFHSVFCGVDIIRNSQTGEYHILEINTAPQWLGDYGFQSITGVPVAEAIIDWIVERKSIRKVGISTAVEAYYKSRIDQIPSEAFHFASRLWLWTGDNWAREKLDSFKQSYIGNTPEEVEQRIARMIEKEPKEVRSVNQKKAYRKDAYSKFENLPLYNSLLFKTVFCDSIYDFDIRPYVRKYISDKDFIDLFNDLIEDKDAIRLLSTHAINYFYLLKNYFKDKISLSSAVLLSPTEITSLLPGYKKLIKDGKIDKAISVKLQIYLLTHAILGQSRFYARRVKPVQYKVFCKKVERLIQNNYYDVSLDNKSEFLVCCQICGYDSQIRKLIEQELKKSISWAGNFLVDTYNSSNNSRTGDCLRISEHRNVLYIMSQRDFVRGADTITAKTTRLKLPSIGRLARVKLPDCGVRRAIARVDSGATQSSIAASDVEVINDVLHFKLFHKGHPLYTGEEFTTTDFKNINVRNTTNEQERYSVMLKFEMGDNTYNILFALADRQNMLYPILLGRNFLTGRYSVDTAKQFVEKRNKKNERKKL